MNYPVRIKKFQESVNELRKELTSSLQTGTIPYDFEERMKEMQQMERILLKDMVPYYRKKQNHAQADWRFIKTESRGFFSFEGYLEAMLLLKTNIYVTRSTTGDIRLLQIHEPDKKTNEQIKVEWSDTLNGNIGPVHSMEKTEQGVYLQNNLQEVFFLAKEDNTLGKIEKSQKTKARFPNEKDLLLSAFPGGIAYEWLENDQFIIGNEKGEIYWGKYKNSKVELHKRQQIFDSAVRKIKNLEDEQGKKDTLLILGDESRMALVPVNGVENAICFKSNALQGNLFEAASIAGTAVILSEDGSLYFLEENLGDWQLNNRQKVEDAFYTNVFAVNSSVYFLFDLDGKLQLLTPERISTSEELWRASLFVQED